MTAWQVRAPRPGELGWIVTEHGRHYVDVEGFAPEFEALVARLLGSVPEVQGRTWIAELGGRPVGTVSAVPEGADLRLRLFYVAEAARGQGIGAALVQTVIDHGRTHGAARVVLATHAEHRAACRLYARMGFACLDSTAQMSFGRALTVQNWALPLAP